MRETIAIYGKGGSGKTTLAANIAVCLAESGRSVTLVGCDPGGDSFPLLRPAPAAETVLRSLGVDEDHFLSDVIRFGYGGTCCVEAGMVVGSGPGGLDRSLSRLLGMGGEVLKRDVVILDLPAGTARGEYRIPVLDGVIQRAYIVASADLTSLYAANGIMEHLREKRTSAPLNVALVANCLNGPLEEALVKDFAELTRTPLLGTLPRSLVIRHAELFGKTVLEEAPESNMAFCLRKIAARLSDESFTRPVGTVRPQSLQGLQNWARGWGDRIYELEQGIVQPGAAI